MNKDQNYSLTQLMRWYGPHDPVPLFHIAQAGCTGVVSALHHIPIGDAWTITEIRNYQKIIHAAGLDWEVVESLPVHDDIKKRRGAFERYIQNYNESLRNLAQCGIKVVTYNFMPVLDWLRTNITYQLANGAETLKFVKADFAVFDLFLLQRPGAEKDYSAEEIQRYQTHFASMPESERKRLFKHVLLGLPGGGDDFTPKQILKELRNYAHIDHATLRENLVYFLRAITPIADEVGIQLAIHPDDPPFSVLGLPRIMSTNNDIKYIMEAVPSLSNGLCFCTGSFGARADNNLVVMAQKWGARIYFLHLRNTQRDEEGNFMEANHLEGNADMYAIMKTFIALMQSEQRSIPMRPDHGFKILDDAGKKTYPGYSAIGRLKALAELRGLEYGIRRSLLHSSSG